MPPKIPTKSSYPKKYLPICSYPKKSRNWKFQTEKSPSIIPVTWNPEYPTPRECYSCKNHPKIVVSAPWWNLFEISFVTLQDHFLYSGKRHQVMTSAKLVLKQQYPISWHRPVRTKHLMGKRTLHIQLNLSSTATLGTEDSVHCRAVETRVNVWTFRQKKWPLRRVGR